MLTQITNPKNLRFLENTILQLQNIDEPAKILENIYDLEFLIKELELEITEAKNSLAPAIGEAVDFGDFVLENKKGSVSIPYKSEICIRYLANKGFIQDFVENAMTITKTSFIDYLKSKDIKLSKKELEQFLDIENAKENKSSIKLTKKQ